MGKQISFPKWPYLVLRVQNIWAQYPFHSDDTQATSSMHCFVDHNRKLLKPRQSQYTQVLMTISLAFCTSLLLTILIDFFLNVLFLSLWPLPRSEQGGNKKETRSQRPCSTCWSITWTTLVLYLNSGHRPLKPFWICHRAWVSSCPFPTPCPLHVFFWSFIHTLPSKTVNKCFFKF